MAIKIKNIWRCSACSLEVTKPTCPDVWWRDHETGMRGCPQYDWNEGHDWECVGEVDKYGNKIYQ